MGALAEAPDRPLLPLMLEDSMRAAFVILLTALCLVPTGAGVRAAELPPAPLKIAVSYPRSLQDGPVDGRLLLLISNDGSAEPRFQIADGPSTQQAFGIDVEAWGPGVDAVFDGRVLGYPRASFADVPAGTYVVQVLLHRYETFKRSDGHTVKLPMDRGEGQQWNLAPGNLYSKPVRLTIDPARSEVLRVTLDSIIPPIAAPADTKYIKHVRILSERLTKFWGRPMYLGAHVLLPEGFDQHPDARYPLVIFHGHFPRTFGGFREEPPDPDLACERSERFKLDCYNRIEQEHAHEFYRYWTGPDAPRMLIVEIQHANPYYDDSYAVNSANLGPYGDAITYELLPAIERRFRGIGQGWARFMYGGSTGGWEALGAQIFYPDDYNGAWAACPDPVDFRAYTVVNIYEDRNAYFLDSAWKRTPRPEERNYLGHVAATLQEVNLRELVLGTHSRSGQQWDIWEAVFSPTGDDGYPQRIWNKLTGEIDRDVAAYWREHYDLSHILRRDWAGGLGRKLEGKLNIYIGDMDSFYLNNAVYLIEDALKGVTSPPYGGEVDYGDRAEHCWNGDHTRPNAISRLRYHQMYLPKIVERLLKTAPAGGDVRSWRY
jgi:hypothetical protein